MWRGGRGNNSELNGTIRRWFVLSSLGGWQNWFLWASSWFVWLQPSWHRWFILFHFSKSLPQSVCVWCQWCIDFHCWSPIALLGSRREPPLSLMVHGKHSGLTCPNRLGGAWLLLIWPSTFLCGLLSLSLLWVGHSPLCPHNWKEHI